MKGVDYNIYATLLNSYQGYLDAEILWNKYWGGSDNPEKGIEEYCEEKRKELIDRINRVPFDSEPADRGTAFNEVIDCLILGEKSAKMEISSDRDNNKIKAVYNGRTFYFPLDFCVSFAKRYTGSVPQYLTEGLLNTNLGVVRLYGYIDELLIDTVVDIKTTSKYSAFKFRDTWQHKVYPYCLQKEGLVDINNFRYDVVVETKLAWYVYEEHYTYNPDQDIPELIGVCEGLINFLNVYKDNITDLKIFNKP